MPEKRFISGHVITVLVGQLAIMTYGVNDTIVVGRCSLEALAALSVATAIFITIYISLLACVQGLLPIWAELNGAGNRATIDRSVRQSLYLVALLTGLGTVLMVGFTQALDLMAVPVNLQPDIRKYLLILAATLQAAMLFRVFTTLNQSIGIPHMVTGLQIAGLILKIPLSIGLVHGSIGLPKPGMEGCAWATFTVNICMLLMAVALVKITPQYHTLDLWRRLEKPDWPQLRTFIRLGLPAGLTTAIEVSSFAMMALLLSR